MLVRGAMGILTGRAGEAARAAGPDLRIDEAGRIAAIGRLAPQPGERILDASGCVVYPGWVNTHHHLAQSVLKGVPAGINLRLMGWLEAVPFRYRRRFDEKLLSLAAQIGLAELLLSGCTATADHHYVYWPDMGYDAGSVLFDEAAKLGLRFVLCRGGSTRARNFEEGDPTAVRPESLEAIFADVERLVAKYHDAGPEPMRRVVLGPANPTFSLEPAELKETARFARRLGLRMHTHLSETDDYVVFCREKYNLRPVQFVAEQEWLGEDVWFAHMVHLDADEIRMVAETRTGTAHCPASNCRLGSGVAPVPELARAGAPVSLGVDGAASNESADMISEAHVCWQVHRALKGPLAATVEDVVGWGTRGGAEVMGLGNVGTLEVGRAADLAVYELSEPRYAGLHDPVIGPVVGGGRPRLRWLTVQGKVVVENDRIPNLDLPRLMAHAREALARLQA